MGEGTNTTGQVKVVSGARDESFENVFGLTVGELTQRLEGSGLFTQEEVRGKDVLINGQQASSNTVIPNNATTIEFVKNSGSKAEPVTTA